MRPRNVGALALEEQYALMRGMFKDAAATELLFGVPAE